MTHVYCVGLALDVCVCFTALHAAEEGFVVTVVLDACAGVADESIANQKKVMQEAGVTLVTSDELPSLVHRSCLLEVLQAVHRIRKVKKALSKADEHQPHGHGTAG